ncbi:sensor histidine kinase [Pseudoneobacillus sp. C159]
MRTRWTIRKKFLFGFFLIFSLSLVLLNLVISNLLLKNSENIIRSDMENIQKYSREYLKQYFLLENLSEDAFTTSGNQLVYELSKNLKGNIALYDQNGTFLNEGLGEKQEYIIVNTKPSILLTQSSKEDLLLALQNKAAFTINTIDKWKIVNFSYPLYIEDDYYGIVRFSKDYTNLFESNRTVLKSLTVFTLALFGAIFLFSYVLSSKITKPLLQLTNAFKEVADGNYGSELTVKTGDEIEELTERFSDMKHQIQQQIATIEAEKEKVERSERSRREFFNNVTHELKTPLTTISGYAQIIADETFDDPVFLQKAASRIQSESERLHEMVVEVIELSKQQSEKLEPIPFDLVTQQLCEDMQLKAAKYQMDIICQVQSLMVYGAENKLRELLINLLDNAIKYGDSHSIIHVSLKSCDNMAILQMTNRSHSLHENVLSNMFEPFYRSPKTDKNEKGSIGLGLYISKKIIEEHNGSIDAHTSGSQITFSVKLPLWQQLGNI